jgi:hypothetical protein
VSTSRFIHFNPEGEVIDPPMVFRGQDPDLQPDDLSKFMPFGNGFYGFAGKPQGNPFVDAPLMEEHGGTVYFDCGVTKDDFLAMMRVLGSKSIFGGLGHETSNKRFVAIAAESDQPIVERYLGQLRIVSGSALYGYFEDCNFEYDTFPEQGINWVEALWKFIEQERFRWLDNDPDNKIAGTFGGDGRWGNESLCFGLTVENAYYGVYRIWSRAWLITK